MSVFVLLFVSGCDDTTEKQADEKKNPHFEVGQDRVKARDYAGAIEAFERALESNPRSALAHFELGQLYEEHEDSDGHLISAMYHYKRAMDLRPHAYPYENAKTRLAGCKQELVKAETLAPVYPGMQRDLEHFKVENANLKKQIEALQVQVASIGRQESAGNSSPQNAANPRSSGGSSRSNSLSAANQPSQGRSDQPHGRFSETHITPLPPPLSQKTYTIQPRDTLASIARKQQVRLDALVTANPGIEPKRLKVGQVLNIP